MTIGVGTSKRNPSKRETHIPHGTLTEQPRRLSIQEPACHERAAKIPVSPTSIVPGAKHHPFAATATCTNGTAVPVLFAAWVASDVASSPVTVDTVDTQSDVALWKIGSLSTVGRPEASRTVVEGVVVSLDWKAVASVNGVGVMLDSKAVASADDGVTVTVMLSTLAPVAVADAAASDAGRVNPALRAHVGTFSFCRARH